MAISNFEITIEPVGDEIEMTVTVGEAIQKVRRGGNGRKNKIKNEKKARHNENHRHPDVIGPHTPFILVDKNSDTDIVLFKCAQPFVIDVEIDEGFDKKGNNPDRSPFGWTTPQASTQPGGAGTPHIVEGRYSKNGNDDTSAHMFYKCTIWSNNIKLDPDFICDR